MPNNITKNKNLSTQDFQNSLGYDIIRLINRNPNYPNLCYIFYRLQQYAGGYLERISKSFYEKLPKEDQEMFMHFFLNNHLFSSVLEIKK